MVYLAKSTAVKLEYEKVEEAASVGENLLSIAGDIKVWLFNGAMGVGKTTFIKELCQAMGVEDTIASPTYSIVNEYQTGEGEPVFHFDFYRINDETEAMDIGAEDYFYSGNLCFIEWPERIPSLIPEKYLKIDMSITPDQKRSLDISKHG